MEAKLKQLIEQLLRETVPLAEAGVPFDTRFLNTSLGVYRVSLATLRDIYYLSSNDDSGLSVLDLSRKILEYMVTIEYMLMKGKEELAARFQGHLWTQMHHELEFLKSIGEKPEAWESDPKEGAKEVEKRYLTLNHHARNNWSWSGKSFKEMLEELHTNGSLKDFDNSRIGQIYVWGSRANHPNPSIVKNYMNTETNGDSNNFYFNLALMSAILSHIRLTTRYIDEIRSLSGKNDYEEIGRRLSDMWKEIDSLNIDMNNPIRK